MYNRQHAGKINYRIMKLFLFQPCRLQKLLGKNKKLCVFHLKFYKPTLLVYNKAMGQTTRKWE